MAQYLLMQIASFLLWILSYSPLTCLLLIWTFCQLILHSFFSMDYPEHDQQGFKSVVVAHNLYRSLVCGIFFITGWYLFKQCLEPGQLEAFLEPQFVLLQTSCYYMLGDILFAFLTMHISTLRWDLLMHHGIALFYIAICWLTGYYYAWSLVCVTELLSVWTGLGSYATYMKKEKLRRFCYLARLVTIVGWRLPWWGRAIYHLHLFDNFFFKILLVAGITVILAMDFYWLHKCYLGVQGKSPCLEQKQN